MANQFEILEGGRVKGGLFRAHIEWVVQLHDYKALDRVLDKLPAAASKTISDGLLANAWYPFSLVVEMDRAIVEVCGAQPDSKAVIMDLGRFSAEINLSGVYRAFNKADPHKFFEHSAIHRRTFLDFGLVEYEKTGENSCRLALTECPCYSRVFCHSQAGYYEMATLLQGGKKPRVNELECQCRGDPACIFDISWK
jgi:predicted hydrocarbon binding protein